MDTTDYSKEWIARREMIAHAEISQISRAIKDHFAHTDRMVRRWGPEYRDAVSLAERVRAPRRCPAVVRNLIDEEMCKQYGWKSILEWNRISDEEFRARYSESQS